MGSSKTGWTDHPMSSCSGGWVYCRVVNMQFITRFKDVHIYLKFKQTCKKAFTLGLGISKYEKINNTEKQKGSKLMDIFLKFLNKSTFQVSFQG